MIKCCSLFLLVIVAQVPELGRLHFWLRFGWNVTHLIKLIWHCAPNKMKFLKCPHIKEITANHSNTNSLIRWKNVAGGTNLPIFSKIWPESFLSPNSPRAHLPFQWRFKPAHFNFFNYMQTCFYLQLHQFFCKNFLKQGTFINHFIHSESLFFNYITKETWD